MKESDLLKSLLAHTGNLRTAAGTTNAELDDLRSAFAASLRTGQLASEVGSLASVSPVSSAVRQDLNYFATQATTSTQRTLLARREFITAERDVVEWAAGMQPARTFGPFIDEVGRTHWFDLFVPAKAFRILRGDQILLLLPVGTRKREGELSLSVAAGTVWIRADQLTSESPANAWVGLRVKAGTLEYTQPSTISDSEMSVLPPAILKLRIDLDPPSTPGPAAGAGSEATNANASLPVSAAFDFGSLGVEKIATTSSSIAAYGNHANLTRSPAQPFYEPLLHMVLIPMQADLDSISIGEVHSTLFRPIGSAPIEKAAWGLTTTISNPDDLAIAAGSGSLVLVTKVGLSGISIGNLTGETDLGKTFIVVDPMSLAITAPKVSSYRGRKALRLWQEMGHEERYSTIDLSFPLPFLLSFVSTRDGIDSLAVPAHLVGHLDRPLTVDGSRLPIEMDGSVALLQKGADTVLGIAARAELPGGFHPMALALTNALFTVTAPRNLFINATLATETQLDKGTLNIAFGLYSALPILPDPYAANFEPRMRDAPIAGVTLAAVITWPDVERPELGISLNTADENLLQILPDPNPGVGDPLRRVERNEDYWLLDVSGGADQLGVVLSIPSIERADQKARMSITGLNLQFPGDQLYTMLLPQFQWEAVYNTRNDRTFDKEGWLEPSVDGVQSGTDGGPSFVRTLTAKLVPLAPAPVAIEMVRAYERGNAPSAALFTLPFGMTARAALQDGRYVSPPGLSLLRTRFDGLRGASQISLTPGIQEIREVRGNEIRINKASLLAGQAQQTQNFFGASTDNTLGLLRDSFNNTFKSQVPIERIDFSGYGASIFSKWLAPSNPDVGITQVSFEAFNGRARIESIQMVTLCWPCLSRFVRTIVLERQGSGAVVRWDSGWLSTSPGLFEHNQFQNIHKGPIDGMYDIREIRDTDQIIELPADAPKPKALVQAVYYDADVAFAPVGGQSVVEAGQNALARVPVRRQLGFIQLVPYQDPHADPPQDFATFPAPILTPNQFEALLKMAGPLGGPIDCRIRIGRSRQAKRVTSLVTDRGGRPNPAQAPEFAVALYGSPVLPASGSWSTVRIDTSDNTVHPVDAQRGVPLIKSKTGPYRWADPEDLLHESEAKHDYGLMMAHDTQRFLFLRPKIEASATTISSTQQPRVADPYSMLSSTGLFPRIDKVIKLPAGTQLLAGSLQLAADNLKLTGPALGLSQKQLVDVQAWKEVADFTKATLILNSLDNWKIQLKQIQQVLEVKGIGEIMRLEHDFESIAGSASKFLGPTMKFASALQAVADVLDLLKHLTPQGGIGPFKLSASFSGATFSLSAVADFQLATEDGDAIECGMGKAKGSLRVGAELSADLGKLDIRGAVFLEITGSWQQEIFPELYGGGHLRFLIRAEQSGDPKIELDACTMGSIGGTLIPGLVDVEATVKYGYFIQMQGGLRPGVVVGMEGRAKLLSGLLGFKFGVEGHALVYPEFSIRDLNHTAIDLYGRIRVAGSVTVAWAIEESKSFETDFDVRPLNWKVIAAAAKLGLLPVP